MNTTTYRVLSAGFAAAALVALGLAFAFLPDGWNLLPLFLIALVILGLAVQWKALRRAEGNEPARAPATATEDGHSTVAAPDREPIPAWGRRANRVFGPIAAGVIIDLVDFATFGPVGLVLGLPVGGLAGYWMGKALGLSRRGSMWCAIGAGIYCTIPGTEFIPLATIVGACARFQELSETPRSKRTR